MNGPNFTFLSRLKANMQNLFSQGRDAMTEIPENVKKAFASLQPMVRPVPDERNMISNVPTYTPSPTQAVAPSPTPIPNPTLPAGTQTAMDFINSQIRPTGTPAGEYYPAFGDEEFMQGVSEADKLRPGLSNLLLLQAFFESTGGRATPNTFGVKPGDKSKHFESPAAALEYQLGPNMLGGGAVPENTNILDEKTPLTKNDVIQLYESYNPNSVYLQKLLEILGIQ
jgi:hypothetical protein